MGITFNRHTLVQITLFLLLSSTFFYSLQSDFSKTNPHDVFFWPTFFIRDFFVFIFYVIYGKILWNHRKDVSKESFKFIIPLCIIFILSLFQLSAKGFYVWGYQYVRNVMYYMPFFYIGLTSHKYGLDNKLLKTLLIFSIVNLIATLLQLGLFTQALYANYRAIGLMENPNIAAVMIVFGIFSVLYSNFTLKIKIPLFFLSGVALSGTVSLSIFMSAYLSFMIVSTIKFFKSRHSINLYITCSLIVISGALCHSLVSKHKESLLKKLTASTILIVKNKSSYDSRTVEMRIKRYKTFNWDNESKQIKSKVGNVAIGIKELFPGVMNKLFIGMDSIISALINWGIIFFCFIVIYPAKLSLEVFFKNSHENKEKWMWASYILVVLLSGIAHDFSYRYPQTLLLFYAMGRLKILNAQY